MTHAAADVEHAFSRKRQAHRLQIRHSSMIDGKRVGSVEDFEPAMAPDALALVIAPPDVDRIRQLRRQRGRWFGLEFAKEVFHRAMSFELRASSKTLCPVLVLSSKLIARSSFMPFESDRTILNR